MSRLLVASLGIALLGCQAQDDGKTAPAKTETPAKTAKIEPPRQTEPVFGKVPKRELELTGKTRAPTTTTRRAPTRGPMIKGLFLSLTAQGKSLAAGQTLDLLLTFHNRTKADFQLPLPHTRCSLQSNLRFAPNLKMAQGGHTLKAGFFPGKAGTVPLGGTLELTLQLRRSKDGATLAFVNDHDGCGYRWSVGGTKQVELRYFMHSGQDPTWFNLRYTKPRWTGGQIKTNPVSITLD